MNKVRGETIKESLEICARGGPCESCYVEEHYSKCARELCNDAAGLIEELMDEIGEWEKREQKREEGCYLCRSCDNCMNYTAICAVDDAMPVCACDDRSAYQNQECSYYQATNYCQHCGRKLVE